jgi:hypothetical protein
MILMTLFPRLAQPIDVPAGEQLHEMLEEVEHIPRSGSDEVINAADVHQSIVEAVDQAEQAAKENPPATPGEIQIKSPGEEAQSRGGKSVSPLG